MGEIIKTNQKMAERGKNEPNFNKTIDFTKAETDNAILEQKFITTLGDMIKLMTHSAKSGTVCKTLSRVIDSPELKKVYLDGFIGQIEKNLSLSSDFKDLVQNLFDQGKIDIFELNAIKDKFENYINKILNYISKSDLTILAF